MRVAELSPILGTAWSEGKTWKASTWTAVDTIYCYHFPCRDIYHYTTLLGRFIRISVSDGFGFEPISVGLGSVSDQKGINQIIRGTGWWYKRAGGAGYIHISDR